MIILKNIHKAYRTEVGKHVVLDNISWEFTPGVNVGILGRNGAGKSTMMRIIGGSELPDSGQVVRKGKISWPIGFGGGFNMKISGKDNLRFICRLYDESYKKTLDFVEDFAELGKYIDMPVYTYSSGMKAKLAFGISMAFNFDYYLIDELTAVGDAVFRRKSEAFFAEKRKTATLIVVSHEMNTVKKFCDKYLLLYKKKLLDFPTNEDALEYYNVHCCGNAPTK